MTEQIAEISCTVTREIYDCRADRCIWNSHVMSTVLAALKAAQAERDKWKANFNAALDEVRADTERLLAASKRETALQVDLTAAKAERDAARYDLEGMKRLLDKALEQRDAAKQRIVKLEADAKYLADYPRMVDIMQNDELKAVCDRVLGHDSIKGRVIAYLRELREEDSFASS